MRNSTSAIQFLLSMAVLAGTASADLITWSAPQDVASASDVRTNGTLVAALNPWAQTFAAPTVNGVTFTSFTPPGWGNGGWLMMDGSSTGDSEYDALLDSCRVTSFGSASNPTEWGAIQLDTLGTLDIGSTYEIQVWFNDQRAGSATNTLRDRTMVMSSAVGAGTLSGGVLTNLGTLTQGTTSGALDADINNMSGPSDTGFGQYVVGTFTRSSSEPLYLLAQGIHPVATQNFRAHLHAFQIRNTDGGSSGVSFCDPMDVNSTGQSTTLSGSFGSGVGSDLHLEAAQGPPNQFGYVLVGTASTEPGLTISQGRLCLDVTGGNIFGRYNVVGGSLNSVGLFDASGVLQNAVGTSTVGSGFDVPITVPITGSPQIVAGQTFHFQLWHREAAGESNFSNGISVTF